MRDPIDQHRRRDWSVVVDRIRLRFLSFSSSCSSIFLLDLWIRIDDVLNVIDAATCRHFRQVLVPDGATSNLLLSNDYETKRDELTVRENGAAVPIPTTLG